MAEAPPTACRTPGCAGTCFPQLGHNFCADCEKQVTARPEVPRGIHDKLMATYRWKHKTSKVLRDCNPVCQHVMAGIQCKYPSREVHHLDANPDQFFNPANLVALCSQCHMKTQGEPNIPRDYVPTRWIMGAVFPHQKSSLADLGPKLLRHTAVPEPQAPDPTVDFHKLLNLPPKPTQTTR